MQTLLEKEIYGFEMSQEVQEKMRQAEDLHQMIPESEVQNLRRVDVSKRFYCNIKRFLDIAITAMGLMVLLVPMAIIALIIYLDDPGKVLFTQYRVGRNGKRFKLYKFRSMQMSTPKYLATAEMGDPQQYYTKVGKILRKLSLDELPQLFNVLKGDMSIVGPRPLISDEYEMHAMRMRFGVYTTRPGITGLAQINGRDAVGPVEKIHFDVQYLQNYGFKTDVKILLSTIPKVLRKEGIQDDGAKQDGE